MKHLLNDLSDEEKNRIREQHTGGKKLVIENFDKLVNTKLGDAKPLLSVEAGQKCEGEVYVLPQQTEVVGRSKVIAWFEEKPRSKSVAMLRCVNGKLKTCGCEYNNKKLVCYDDNGPDSPPPGE